MQFACVCVCIWRVSSKVKPWDKCVLLVVNNRSCGLMRNYIQCNYTRWMYNLCSHVFCTFFAVKFRYWIWTVAHYKYLHQVSIQGQNYWSCDDKSTCRPRFGVNIWQHTKQYLYETELLLAGGPTWHWHMQECTLWGWRVDMLHVTVGTFC